MCGPKDMIQLNRRMFAKIIDDFSLERKVSYDLPGDRVAPYSLVENFEPCFDIVECINECRREVFTLAASHSDFELAPNFKFDNWSIQPEERCAFSWLLDRFEADESLSPSVVTWSCSTFIIRHRLTRTSSTTTRRSTNG